MKLELQNITGGYLDGQDIIHNINLTISSYESVLIIGQNGAGKSTLGKVILGMLPYFSGKVLFDDIDISNKKTIDRVKSGIGYFMQGGEVFPNLSAIENLVISGNELSRKSIYNRIDQLSEYITFLRSKDLKKKASYLSGGERHQLALAMVLLRSPKLLILDEPSSGLSPILMNDLFKILQNLKENEELTIILIEQNTLKAIEFFERLILIENGKIEKDANSFDLISNNKINDLIYR